MPDRKYEILAPVGSYESLFAAVRSGADAVYFGLKDFSARRNAENFSVEEMEKGVKYCRRNGVKTYLTLNVAVKEKELDCAFELAKKAYFAGVDGFIISDLGLARIIKDSMPDVELHASTQMTVNSPAALPILKELGFCRVVPAREMSKKELVSFCKKAKELGIEVEVFVHGALCMCLSGQCLMSSVLGGRSGNRGLCAGPCRLPFAAENGTGYDLSLKDLSLLDHIDDLLKMGVYSFKIEGRMKRPEYIAAAVTACRSAASNGALDSETKQMLEDVFSRSGFTDGYFTGNLGREMFGVRRDSDALKSKKVHGFLHGLYRNEYQRIPIGISVSIKRNMPIEIVFDSGKARVSATGGTPQEAKTRPTTNEDIKTLASKLGGTPYTAEKTEVLIEDGLFVSAGEINDLRRICCEKLGEIFEKIPQRRFFERDTGKSVGNKGGQAKIYAEFADKKQIPDDLSGVDLVILPLEGFEKTGTQTAVKLPKFIDSEEAAVSRLAELREMGVTKAVCGTLSAVSLAKKCGFDIIGGIGLNVLNRENTLVLKELGVEEITLSAEIDIRFAQMLETPLKKGIFAYGRLPLMAVKNCPIKNGKTCAECQKNGRITDRLGTGFPVLCHGTHCEILNSKPLYLADKNEAFSGLDFIVLSFTVEQKDECRRIIDAYLTGAAPKGDFTRGLYFKEVM